MKTNKQLFFWIIDAVLWVSFLVLYFLDLTGLDLHQWLGVIVSAFAGYHLLLHASWVNSVTSRLHKVAGRVRLNYLVDAALLAGFGLMLVTGLVISSWLNLGLDNYTAWKDLHVGSAIGSLAVLAAKIGLHWRWIVQTGQRLVTEVKAEFDPRLVLEPRTAPNAISRRHFLTVLTLTGISAGVAATNVLSEDKVANAAALPAAASTTGTTTSAAAATTSSTASTSSTCTVRCNKGCSFPGKCRKYTDTNGNKKCDLGECM